MAITQYTSFDWVAFAYNGLHGPSATVKANLVNDVDQGTWFTVSPILTRLRNISGTERHKNLHLVCLSRQLENYSPLKGTTNLKKPYF